MPGTQHSARDGTQGHIWVTRGLGHHLLHPGLGEGHRGSWWPGRTSSQVPRLRTGLGGNPFTSLWAGGGHSACLLWSIFRAWEDAGRLWPGQAPPSFLRNYVTIPGRPGPRGGSLWAGEHTPWKVTHLGRSGNSRHSGWAWPGPTSSAEGFLGTASSHQEGGDPQGRRQSLDEVRRWGKKPPDLRRPS